MASNWHKLGGPSLPTEDSGMTESGLHLPSTKETFDITNPKHQLMVATRLARFGQEMGKTHPDVVSEGAQWYDTAHEGLNKSRGNLSMGDRGRPSPPSCRQAATGRAATSTCSTTSRV